MRFPWTFIVFTMLACTAEPETVMANRSERPIRLEEPDLTFRLTSSQRARVPRSYDAAALERLLQRVRTDERAEILRQYVLPEVANIASMPRGTARGVEGQERGEIGDVQFVTGFGDPVLDEILAEVWAPFWESLPPDAVDREDMSMYPGSERARTRRAKSRSGDKK